MKIAPNVSHDVEVVQRLLAIAARSYAATNSFGLPQPTGKFDPVTGFYIFTFQERQHRRGHTAKVVDGVASPAKATSYGGSWWTIVEFNYICYVQDRFGWEALLARYPGQG
jgi:hypothetical protein